MTPLTFSRVDIPVALVSLETAKDHLGVTDAAHDADISQKLEAAQELIVARLGPAADATWTEATVPRFIRSAILLVLDALYERRGGDETQEELRKASLVVDLLLSVYRDPGLA